MRCHMSCLWLFEKERDPDGGPVGTPALVAVAHPGQVVVGLSEKGSSEQ